VLDALTVCGWKAVLGTRREKRHWRCRGKATWGSLAGTNGLAQPAGDLQPYGSLAYSLAAPDCDAPLGSRRNDVRVHGLFYMACRTLCTKACNSPKFRFETAQ
jgi:hypothetical protein